MIVEKPVHEIGFDQVCFVMEDNLDTQTHTLTASWKHKYRPQLWDTALFLAYPTEKQDKVFECLCVLLPS